MVFYFTSDPNAVVYTGGFANSNPYDYSATTQSAGFSQTGDQAIGIILKSGDLTPGTSVTFRYFTALTTGTATAGVRGRGSGRHYKCRRCH